MLGLDHSREVAPADWASLDARAEQPRDLEGFFSRSGPMPAHPEDRRRHRRFYLRGQAIILAGGELLAGFTSDVSRTGIALVSPVQAFPRDELRVWLPDRPAIDVRVVRCVRLDERCYSVAAVFNNSDEA